MGACYSDCAYYEKNDAKRSAKKAINSKTDLFKNMIIFGQDKNGKDFNCVLDWKTKTLDRLVPPKDGNFINYCGVTQKSENTMIVCGGIRFNLVGISDQCFEFDLSANTIRKLPNMLNIRYTFPIIFMNEKIYVIGGRVYGDDTHSILKKCEVFDYLTWQWKSLPDLNVSRCTSSAIVYNKDIWVFGGYTGQYERSRKIERFDEQMNVWRVLSFRLMHGFENGSISPTKNPNEVIIFGGKFNYGASMSVMLYNFEQETVVNMKPLSNDHVLSKQFITNDKTCVLVTQSENDNIIWESYNTDLSQYDTGKLNGKILKDLIKFKQYNYNSSNIEVAFEDSKSVFLEDYADYNIVFGNDLEPFQLVIHNTTGEVLVQPLSLHLSIKHSQGVIRLNGNELFFCGGTNRSEQKFIQKSFVFNLVTRKVSHPKIMNRSRHSFAITRLNDQIYVCGGKEGTDFRTGTIAFCESYDLRTNTWQSIAALNFARSDAQAFVFGDRVFVAGGNLANGGKTDTIELFNEQKNTWFGFGILLPMKMSSPLFFLKNDFVFIGSGCLEQSESFKKYKINLRKGDFGKPELIMGTKKTEATCSKMAFVKDKIVIFGGSKNVCILERDNFKNFRQELSADFRKGCSIKSNENREEGFWNNLESQIDLAIGKVSFSSSRLKCNAFVTSEF